MPLVSILLILLLILLYSLLNSNNLLFISFLSFSLRILFIRLWILFFIESISLKSILFNLSNKVWKLSSPCGVSDASCRAFSISLVCVRFAESSEKLTDGLPVCVPFTDSCPGIFSPS